VFQGPAQSRQHRAGGQAGPGAPADDPPAPQVQNHGHVEPAFARGHVGQVADPDLVGAGGRRPPGQAAGRQGPVVGAVGGAGDEPARGAPAQAVLFHQPGDAFGAVALAAPGQGLLEAPGAVASAVGGVQLPELVQQGGIGGGAGAGRGDQPGVVARTGDVESRAELGDGVRAPHGFEGPVAVVDGSQRMPRLFLRCRAVRARGPVRPGGRGSPPPGWPARGWRRPDSGASIP
jgi:hypothetical protein